MKMLTLKPKFSIDVPMLYVFSYTLPVEVLKKLAGIWPLFSAHNEEPPSTCSLSNCSLSSKNIKSIFDVHVSIHFL